MTRQLDVDRSLESWLAEGPSQLPDHVIDGIVRQLDEKHQRRSMWLPRRQQMNRMILAIGGIAAAVALAFVAVGLYFNGPGVAAPPPTAPPTTAPTVSPTVQPTSPPTAPPSPSATPTLGPSATPQADPVGDLVPGTYAVRPLPAPNDSLTLTFTVPDGWSLFDSPVLVHDPSDSPGDHIGFQFIEVTTLEGDPCDWLGSADDVSTGSSVDDLVEALRAQTAYEVSDPVDVVIGGYSGKRVDMVMPTEPFIGQGDDAPECDSHPGPGEGGQFSPWITTAYGEAGIWAQGPANRWQTNILDVEGTRLVIVAMDFPGTSAEDRAELDAIIESIVIEP